MSKFQLTLLIVFGVFIVGAVLVFAFSRGKSGGVTSANVVIWGTIPAYNWSDFYIASSMGSDQNLSVSYVEKPANSIEQDFVEALASGVGPDIIILSQEQFLQYKNKLTPIPYSSINPKTFKDTFIEEGELFLSPEGVYALPLVIDPMVLYTNRDILSKASIAKPIEYWDKIYAEADKLTTKDSAGNISNTVMSLGTSNNIPNAKSILSLLMLQAGTPITEYLGTNLQSALANNYNLPFNPAEAALDFYTQFSNPTKAFYSWNRAMPSADIYFTSGNAAYYVGFASELSKLKNKNPSLNLGIYRVPQSSLSPKAVTFGRLYALSVPKASKNQSAAFSVALKIVSKQNDLTMSKLLGLAPARRDLLAERPTDDTFSVFYDSALISKGWLDPSNEGTYDLWGVMIDSVTSGRARIGEAVSSANNELNNLIKK